MAGDEGNDPSSFGSKPNVSTCPLIPNIKTALFIQLAATSTVYEDYERNFMTTSSMFYMMDYITQFLICQELFHFCLRVYSLYAHNFGFFRTRKVKAL